MCLSHVRKTRTYTIVNQLRYDSFSQKYQATPGQALNSFDGIDTSIFPPCRALVFCLLSGNAYPKSQLSGIHIGF